MRISGNTYIANLTLISTHRGNSSLVVDGEIKEPLSYGLHIDDRHNEDGDYKTTIENCYIYSEQNPAVGIGLDKNQTIELLNCELVSNIANDVKNATSCIESAKWAWKKDSGALFYHALYPAYQDDSGEQRLRVKNCILKNNTNNIALGESGGLEENVILEFINNVGCSESNGVSFVNGLTGATLSPLSYGNNFKNMNYN